MSYVDPTDPTVVWDNEDEYIVSNAANRIFDAYKDASPSDLRRIMDEQLADVPERLHNEVLELVSTFVMFRAMARMGMGSPNGLG